MDIINTLNKLLGDPNEKELKKIKPLVKVVRDLQHSDAIQALALDDLPTKTAEFQKRVQEDGESLDDILPEAFAVVIRACELLKGSDTKMDEQTLDWNMIPYDVQIIGGIVLHRGSIAEMKTGEGKTLVCTMPVYLNALTGKGVHVVTVNDYLARRDATWMGMLYEALGLTVGVITHELKPDDRKEVYEADIVYGTNNEFGFDYLRDNMAGSIERQVQRSLHYAIVDEVDSILIDEARTPLIISQPGSESTEKYMQHAILVKNLKEGDHYVRDEKQRVATLTEEGVKEMERLLGVDNVYTDRGFEEVHHIEQALRAHAIYQRDVDYVVRDGEIVIVDEFTGRLMPGRRYGHGLHQAIEAKEKVEVQRESKTLATITFQNYFRLYDKLAGMTGTAKTEEEEFESIYKLRTFVIPTHRPVIRDDRSDAVYRTVAAKFKAVAKLAKEKHEKGQPVLIGTTSIEKSEALSSLLEQEKVPHQVLNAKQHQKEAQIVSDAGQQGSVTIATNMAGRGTDIKLGKGVADLGGLCILGTERHESRRIDNQLRGRSGRQGDPGESVFFVSMEDELMRLFGGDRLKSMMERMGVPDDQPLNNSMVSRSIESAQKRVEGRNFDIRRHVVQYDDVMNKHREIIYVRRQKILEKLAADFKDAKADDTSSLHDDIVEALRKEARSIATAHASDVDQENWNVRGMRDAMRALHPAIEKQLDDNVLLKQSDKDEVASLLSGILVSFYENKCDRYEDEVVIQAERVITLQAIDTHWMQHIDDMAHLREQVAFSGYAQRDPLIEYKDQGFQRFQELLTAIDNSIVQSIIQVDFGQFSPRVFLERANKEMENLQTNEGEIEAEFSEKGVAREAERLRSQQASADNPVVLKADDIPETPGMPRQAPSASQFGKVGRNDPCPCGSGKKFKKCHGTNA